jgi:5'-nucleotidase
MTRDLEKWSENITESTRKEVGRTRVFLDGRGIECRLRECNMGNLIADAMVHVVRHLNIIMIMSEKEAVFLSMMSVPILILFFIFQNLKYADDLFWSDVSIAILNSGGIRSSIEETSKGGV